MTSYRRKVLLNALKAFDLLLALAIVILATYIALPHRSEMSLAEFLAIRVKVGNFVLFAALLFMWHLTYVACGLYNSRRMLGCLSDIRDPIKACVAGTALIGTWGAIFHVRMFSPQFLIIFLFTSSAASIISRLVIRATLRVARKRGHNLRNILIVGTGPRASRFASIIESKPELGYRILGFVDQPWIGLKELQGRGYSVLCDFEGLQELLRTHVVDEVVIALPIRSLHVQAAQVAAACELQGIPIRVFSDLFDQRLSRARTDDILGGLLIGHHRGMDEGWRADAKRVFDIAVSSVVLILLLPLFLVIAAIIKLSGPGPVFFTQGRVGLGKRQFRMYKFRTMVVDAEQKLRQLEHLNEASGPVFKLKNDPRVTTIGKFLRKSSLDELPQLINVLLGEMSLVGPRPLPLRDYEGFNQDWQRRRFSVRPGLTCLWQVAGRSSIPFETWMQLDLQYIDGWTFWLDLQILMRTIPAVLKGFGAF
jgi:exopolysaccharide biosynthesis polyprenyl glycosylphosphotransferase